MKSVGEAMAIRWTLQESLQKAVRSLECGYSGWGCAPVKELDCDWDQLNDKQIAFATKSTDNEVRSKWKSFRVSPAYKWVDTCATEFEANTPYVYSSYDFECESAPNKRKKVLILSGGPNRIGQAIEFDFCCCHTSFALESAGYETIMMNSNPETFGRQTPLKLALPIQQYLEDHKPVSSSGVRVVCASVHHQIPLMLLRTGEVDPEHPVLIDTYLSDAVEIDIDALADSHGNAVIGGIMEHIEQAGVHSGDSACILPTQTVSSFCLATIRSWTTKLAKSLNVCGLMNCQYAITAAGEVFLLEANPCASRTVPFVSKEIGHPLAKYAALVLSGVSLNENLSLSGTVFISFNDLTKRHLEKLAKAFSGLGFRIISTSGTANFLELKDIPVYRVLKMHEGRPHAGDMLANGQIQLMVITSSGDALDQIDGRQLRRMALAYSVPIITTVAGALATAEAMKTLKSSNINMIALQDFFNVEIHEDSSKNLQSASSSL
ncbi:hypothetical protein GH714_003258 [Hevea brasiliensis]|uniref:carbamoyl-phosphate synthase (glutamine-hydrolyzing) n=1 Tax=Hevea brasiliensis TaxID=3981 RepID=A0A6A6NBI5_HEVBR|nr:hypothetical protein GH714_003258 [Hevea brasiliensis]